MLKASDPSYKGATESGLSVLKCIIFSSHCYYSTEETVIKKIYIYTYILLFLAIPKLNDFLFFGHVWALNSSASNLWLGLLFSFLPA